MQTFALKICSRCFSELLFFLSPMAKENQLNRLIKGNVSQNKNDGFLYFPYF